jgi:tetratricopeptide (TPR) repeat protein
MGGTENELTTEAYDFGDDTGIVEKWSAQGKPVPPKPAVGPPPISSPPPKDKSAKVEPRARISSLDESVVKPSNRGVGLFVAAGLLAVGVGATVALVKSGVLSNSHTTTTVQSDAVRLAIDFADESLRAGTRASFDEARERLTLMLTQPQNQNDPRLHAARGAILAARGETIRQKAEDSEARAQSNPADAATLRAEAALLRGGASADIERARTDGAFAEANTARVAAADRPRFLAALSEIARIVQGDLQSARRYATEAHGLGLNVDTLDGLIARDAGEYDNALSALRRATRTSASDARARFALARLFAAHGDAGSAREQLTSLLQTRATRDEAQALITAIDAQQAPFVAAGSASADAGARPVVATPATVVVADSGIVAAVNNPIEPSSTGTTPNSAQNANPTTNAGTNAASNTGSTSYAGRSYDSLVAEGERQRGRGRMEPARSAFMAALQIRGDGCEAISGLAAVEVAAGDERAAVLLFRRALSINSRYSDAYFGLGQAYERMGNSEGATSAYRQYLEVNPGGSRAAAARTRLDALERRNTGSSGSGANPTTPPNSGSTASPTNTPPSETPANSGSTSPPIGGSAPTGGT